MLEKDLAVADKNATHLFILAQRFALELGDAKCAVELYKKAAKIQNPVKGGHPVAMLHLAVHYERGIGTERDYAQGFYWYNCVIQHPFPGGKTLKSALVALSRFYKDGLGGVVEKSSEMATKYLAFSHSNPETLEELKHLETWWETTGQNLDPVVLTGP